MMFTHCHDRTAVRDRRHWMQRAASLAALFVLALPPAANAADAAPGMLLLDGALVGRDIVAVGERGTILRSADQARSWKIVGSPTRATLTAVDFAPSQAQRGWAVGHDAVILATTDGGRTWAKQYQGDDLQESFLDVLALDEQRAIAVGAYGLFLRTNDAGKSWTPRKLSDDDYHLNRITRGSPDELYLAGEHGTLLRSTDGGVTWTRIPTDYTGSFYGILPLSRAGFVLAHGLRGRLYRSSDRGATWQQVVTPHPALLMTACELPDHTIIVAGLARGMLFSRDGGATFAPVANAPTTAVARILDLRDGRLLLLGEAGATVMAAPK